MASVNDFLVDRATAEKALARDGMALDDFEETVLGLVSDGHEWEVLEDSLDEEEALRWAQQAEGYGEVVGLFKWAGA